MQDIWYLKGAILHKNTVAHVVLKQVEELVLTTYKHHFVTVGTGLL